jgi:hypothetical protein
MKKHFMDCVQANGVFLVTTIVLNSVVMPLGRSLLLSGEDTVTQNYLLPALLLLVSLIFYVYAFQVRIPNIKVGLCVLYVLLLLLNGGYYLQIAYSMERLIRRPGAPDLPSTG